MKFKLAEMRARAGLSQVELAKMIGKGHRTIQSWEAGLSYPNAESLHKLSVALNTTPNDLISWGEDPEAQGLTGEEESLIAHFRSANHRARGLILDGAKALSQAFREVEEDVIRRHEALHPRRPSDTLDSAKADGE